MAYLGNTVAAQWVVTFNTNKDAGPWWQANIVVDNSQVCVSVASTFRCGIVYRETDEALADVDDGIVFAQKVHAYDEVLATLRKDEERTDEICIPNADP